MANTNSTDKLTVTHNPKVGSRVGSLKVYYGCPATVIGSVEGIKIEVIIGLGGQMVFSKVSLHEIDLSGSPLSVFRDAVHKAIRSSC